MIYLAKVSTNISIDAETKAKAQALLADFGMDLSTAVNIFLRQMVYEGSFPVAITRKLPNETTIAAMDEYYEMKNNPEKYKRYSSFKEALNEVINDD